MTDYEQSLLALINDYRKWLVEQSHLAFGLAEAASLTNNDPTTPSAQQTAYNKAWNRLNEALRELEEARHAQKL